MSPVATRVAGLLLDPPLDPTPDEARSRLRRELLRPEYNDQNLFERVLRWVDRQINRGLDAASGAPPLSALAAMVVLVLLVGALAWLLSRQRVSARRREEARAVLTDEVVTAATMRERARRALAEERLEDAVVDGFRALTLRQVERGVLEQVPGTTARDVARAVGERFPDRGPAVEEGATLFEAVLYGDRPASRAQAEQVLALDDELAVAR